MIKKLKTILLFLIVCYFERLTIGKISSEIFSGKDRVLILVFHYTFNSHIIVLGSYFYNNDSFFIVRSSSVEN